MLTSFSMRTLLDTMTNAIFIKNEDLRFVYVNKAYEDLFGVTKEYMIGKTVLDVEHLPDDDKKFYHNEDREMVYRAQIANHIFQYHFKDGKMHTCLYWSGGFIQDDGRRGLIGTIVDITQQSQTIESLEYELETVVSEKRAIEEQMLYDPLTGVHNRHSFEMFLQNYASLSMRNNTPFSCIMIDADHFKKVNDTFGHLTGDEVLRQLGSILTDSLRGNDVVCRYGGEEFVLLLPGSELGDALLVAERLRVRVAETISLPCGHCFTVSSGCSEYRPGEEEHEFLKRADNALYAAKGAGRNCVCMAKGDDIIHALTGLPKNAL